LPPLLTASGCAGGGVSSTVRPGGCPKGPVPPPNPQPARVLEKGAKPPDSYAEIHAIPMFIFKNSRSSLVRKIWKLKKGDNVSQDTRSVLKGVLGRLKRSVLESLGLVLERGGEDCGPCALIPPANLRVGKQSLSPVFLICQVWRWADLQEGELVRLPVCRASASEGGAYECCNPFHWAREATPRTSLCTQTVILLCILTQPVMMWLDLWQLVALRSR